MAGWDDVSAPAGTVPTDPWAAVSAPVAPRSARTFLDAVQAGYQQSVLGLSVRRALPDVQMDPNETPWYNRFAGGVTSMIGDLPAVVPGMLGGGAAGGAAGSAAPVVGTAIGAAVGAGAGAMAAPAIVREALMQHYRGEDIDVAKLAKVGGVELLIGGATFGVGRKVGALVGVGTGGTLATRAAQTAVVGGTLATRAAQTAVVGGSEVATMVGTRSAVEMRLPEAHEFVDAAALVFGLRGVAAGTKKLQEMYRRTGVEPGQALAAAERDPRTRAELASDDVRTPEAFKPFEPRGVKDEVVREPLTAERARQILDQPFAQDVPTTATWPFADKSNPNRMNLNFVAAADDVKAVIATVAKDAYTGKSEVSLATERAAAEVWLRDSYGRRAAGDKSTSTVELLARRDVAVRAAEEVSTLARAYHALKETGVEPTVEQRGAVLAAIQRLRLVNDEFMQTRAEAGRALRALRETTDAAKRTAMLEQAVKEAGDPKAFDSLMGVLSEVKDASDMVRIVRKATLGEMVLEGWKAGLVSGPVTQVTNLVSNLSYTAFRLPESVLEATIGKLTRSSDRVLYRDIVGEAYGMATGAWLGVTRAWKIVNNLDPDTLPRYMSAAEGHVYVGKIPGLFGEIVRYPFRILSAGDAIFRAIHEEGTRYSLAFRQAFREGDGVVLPNGARLRELLRSDKIDAAAKESGFRYTFTKDLGETGQAFQKLLATNPTLGFVVPFVRTPTNIFKETAKYVPGVNLLLRETRDALRAGGARRDEVLAQMVVGGSVMSAVWFAVDQGFITGGGSPDPKERATQRAAGWQPYSIYVNGQYYSYARLEPIASLLGMTADFHTANNYMTAEETDRASKMLWFGFTNQVSNKTFLQPIANLMGALTEPSRKFDRWFSGFVASFVPSILAQPASMADPYQREAQGVLNAIQNRVPGMREGLMPKRDLFGVEVPNFDRVWHVMPFNVSTLTDDKVRLEAARLGILTPTVEKKLDVVPGVLKGEVELTDTQRDYFARSSGQLAYEVLKPIVNSSGWDAVPDIVKQQTYSKAMSSAREYARAQIMLGAGPEPLQKAVKSVHKSMGSAGFIDPRTVDLK